jgi:hypothetical protein
MKKALVKIDKDCKHYKFDCMLTVDHENHCRLSQPCDTSAEYCKREKNDIKVPKDLEVSKT